MKAFVYAYNGWFSYLHFCMRPKKSFACDIPCLSFDHWLLQHLLFWTYSHKENQPLLLTLPWSRGVVCRHNALRVTCTSGSACRDLGYRGYLSEGYLLCKMMYSFSPSLFPNTQTLSYTSLQQISALACFVCVVAFFS